MCHPGLIKKRLDVRIEGITTFAPTRDMKSSATLRRLEGHNGVVLLERAVDPASLVKQKILVYRVGPSANKHGFPARCIKPIRVDPVTGHSLNEARQRVVVIGADVGGDAAPVGQYGETRPGVEHPLGVHVIAVRLEGRPADAQPSFFHVLHLCLAKNEFIECFDCRFEVTKFN